MRATFAPVVLVAIGTGACSSNGGAACVDGGAALSATSKPPKDGSVASSEDSSTPGDDSSAAPDAPAAASRPVAGIRVANWAPDAPPIDLCLAIHATGAFEGPLLGKLLAAQPNGASGFDGGTAALPFPLVSAYVLVAPAQYDARLLPAGASNCSTGVLDETQLPPLGMGQYATVALMGYVNPPMGAATLELVGFIDDWYATSGIALRFINASPALAQVDFGSGVPGVSFKRLFSGIPFGQSGASPPDAGTSGVDRNGYLSTGALNGATLSLSGPGDAGPAIASVANVFAAAGSVLTFAAVGTSPVQIVETVDNAGTVGILASSPDL